jgi:hypothetical protein
MELGSALGSILNVRIFAISINASDLYFNFIQAHISSKHEHADPSLDV